MWIVKIGGSMNRDPLLPQWLELMGQIGGGRVVIVCGGGLFADAVRQAQAHWHFDDPTAHNMALLAMAQSAYQAHGLAPGLQIASKETELRKVLRTGRCALWLPFELLGDHGSSAANWEVTSDSIALELADRLNAERLVLVKSCAIDPGASLEQLSQDGVLDQAFPAIVQAVGVPVDLLHRTELERMRSLLQGGGNFRGMSAR